MNNFSKDLLAALIPSGIGAIITTFTDVLPDSAKVKIFFNLSLYIIIAIIIILFDLLWTGYIKAHFNLWYIGKLRGLWEKKGLINQINKNFYSSNIIKVKVTRGYELLESNNEYGIDKILNKLKDDKGKNHTEKVIIKFLLILPCFQEKHVRERYQRHQKMTQKEYLNTWYKFLENIHNYNTDHLSINVKFYFGDHSRWRFYIFSKPQGKSTTVLLSNYDENESGCEQPMYKVMKSDNNLGGFMNDYFDDLWNSALTFSDLNNFITSGKCIKYYGGKCLKNDETNFKNDDEIKCKYIDDCDCKGLIKDLGD